MPRIDQFNSKEEYNQYYRDYYQKNHEKLKAYKREWMKKDRAKKKEENKKALKDLHKGGRNPRETHA